MGEKIGARFLLANSVALIGIVVMVGHATRPQDEVGRGFAFIMTLAFGTQLVMAGRYPALEMAPTNAMGAALCAVVCWPFLAAGTPSFYQLIILALFAITTTSLAYILFLTGGRHIPSGEAGLVGLLDVVLAPFWVWLVFGERPGQAAIIGGTLVLVPVLWYLTNGQRKSIARNAA
jgi:drug/metabolite transporter (DMT)-like permease